MTLVAYITGPTAVGKSDVALFLAERHGWSILSVDSRQIYRGLEAGTAKPGSAERARVPHLLLDLLDPRDACSAGRFRGHALEALEVLRSEGRHALAVGGAGLYWEALTRGLHALPPASAEIRARHESIVAAEGTGGLYRRLREIDPDTAGRLAPGDRQRIGRALEVAELTGEPMSRILARSRREGSAAGVPVIALLRDRRDLNARIEERCGRMLDSGLIPELRALLASDLPPDAPGLRTVGYREFLPHVLAGAPLEECRERFLRASRHYAKRQETWIRHRIPERIDLLLKKEERPETTAARVEEILRLDRLRPLP